MGRNVWQDVASACEVAELGHPQNIRLQYNPVSSSAHAAVQDECDRILQNDGRKKDL